MNYFMVSGRDKTGHTCAAHSHPIPESDLLAVMSGLFRDGPGLTPIMSVEIEPYTPGAAAPAGNSTNRA